MKTGMFRNDPAEVTPGESGRPPATATGREGGDRKVRAAFFRRSLFLFLVMGVLSGCASLSGQPVTDPAAWPGRCEALRRDLEKDPSAAVVATPRPDRSYSVPYWVLVVDGVSIPIPPVPYRDIRVLRAGFSRGLPTVVLVGAEPPTAVSLTSMPPPPPYEDLFALAGEDPTDEGRALTKRLFGGPVKHDRLLEIGYAGRPADLTCRPENREKEIPLAVALILKTVGNPLEEVHEGIAGRRGWMTLTTEKGEAVRWQATLPANGRWLLIDVRTAAGGPFRDAGLAVGRNDMVRALGRPSWLAALAAVLDDPENGRLWEVLADALAKADFPPESVGRVRQMAPGAVR